MRVVERQCLDHTARVLEGRVVLTRKSDDDVRPQTHVGHARDNVLHEFDVFGHRILTAHCRQSTVVATLQWHVEIGAHDCAVAHQVDKSIVDRRRLDRTHANPFDPRFGGERLDNVDQRPPAILVGPDVDAGDDELAMALGCEHPRLAQNIVEITAACGPTALRDDAERTNKVAALLHLEVGARVHGVEPGAVDGKTLARGALAHDHGLGGLHRLGNDLEQAHLFRRADDVVQAVNGAQLVDAGLRVTSNRGDTGVGVAANYRANQPPALGGRLRGKRAGVDHAQIGIGDVADQLVAAVAVLTRENRRLRLIEPAAERLECNFVSHWCLAKNGGGSKIAASAVLAGL